jgi:hypothetical protein
LGAAATPIAPIALARMINRTWHLQAEMAEEYFC